MFIILQNYLFINIFYIIITIHYLFLFFYFNYPPLFIYLFIVDAHFGKEAQ